MLITVMDLCAFIISLVMMSTVMIRYKKIDTLFVLLGAAVIMNCMGRYLLSVSQTLSTALWALKLLYIGGCYAAPLLIMVIFKLCNLKLHRFAVLAMTLYSTFIIGLVLTVGHSDVYYKEFSLVFGNGYSYIEKTYGSLYFFYPIMMGFYGLFFVGFIVFGFRARNKVSIRTVLSASAMGLIIIMSYLLEKLLSSNASFMSIGYLVSIMVIIRYFDRINMYDMSANIISAVEEKGEYGYIVFDKKARFISSNRYIKEIFPEINDWRVDGKLKFSDTLLYTEIVLYFMQMGWKSGYTKVISVDDKYFDVNCRNISHGKKQVGYLIEFVDRTIEHKCYNSIEDYNEQLKREVEAQTANIMHIKDMMVLGMADMVESRDNNTGGHIKRTSAVVRVFSKRLKEYSEEFGLSDAFLKMVEKAAPMHDLGKIAIDDRVLRKPGKFTDEEYNEMKRHTTEGARIVENILKGVEDDDFVVIARNVALYHHEKWNGRGYPTGISDKHIPVEARIMALADVFDALVSKRCYKDAFSYDKAFEIIEESLGDHFDPELGKVFLECRPELEQIYNG